jgi:hypothetical protein
MTQSVPVPSIPDGMELCDIVRIDTALSRYPIHRLANKGNINISIQEKDERGTTALRWEVDYGARHGQPGPLAYKLDTLVINRRIDDAGRPVPKILRLGSLHEIAQELGLERNTSAARKALLQNVGVTINCKIRYRAVDKSERWLEAAFSRYDAIFTGDALPDGSRADCVHLVLHETYLSVLNAALRRPLDYDYLRELPPAPQRFYEILSYQMLPAIKYNQRAKLAYSDFCLFSTLTRYESFDQVKKQMYKIHQPHVHANYIAKIEYEATTDEAGRPDWNIFYLPGELAKRQQLAFDFGVSCPRTERRKIPSAARNDKAVLPLTEAPSLPLLSEAAQQQEERTGELVRRFYMLRYGQKQEPTEREIGEAQKYLDVGESWANFLVEFAAQQGKETQKFPNDFGGVKKLMSQARDAFETERKTQGNALLRKARQSHEEAHQGAYRAFLKELLNGRMEASLPETFRLFREQEESCYRFHKQRAEKSAVSARTLDGYYEEEKRLARLIKFIEENPKSGLPTFWQWDEKMNPQQFDPNRF